VNKWRKWLCWHAWDYVGAAHVGWILGGSE